MKSDALFTVYQNNNSVATRLCGLAWNMRITLGMRLLISNLNEFGSCTEHTGFLCAVFPACE